MNAPHYKNWQLTLDKEQIAWLHFDNEDRKANILNTFVVKELDEILTHLAHNKPKALVILSNKAAFCMGADIHEFADNSDLELIRQHLAFGQAVMQKLADLSFPTIALINGYCLGGGLELSLACRYRIAQEDALLALPEVRLGIQPGWGGTVRLPQVVHPLQAINMMLTGRMVKAFVAKKMGLVDIVVPKRQMQNAARYIALNGFKKSTFHFSKLLMQFSFIRQIVGFFIRQQLLEKASPAHYPAPYQIVDNWKKYGARGKAAFTAEVKGFMHLLSGNTAKNLIRVFLLQEQLKSAGKKANAHIKQVHVIGAGTMGGDIAIWCAQQGLTVSLQDKTPQALSHAMARAHELCADKKVLDHLIPDVNGDGIAHADLIIEAVFEDLAVKQKLFSEISNKVKPTAIIASNTSSISLTEFPYPIVGIHFFNPVAKLQLVEVVHTDALNPEILDRAIAFVHQISKLPIKVKNCPGFLVNRVLAPYLLESARVLQEGMPVEQLDKIATDFGMVIGPGMLIDLVGLDICLAAVKNLGGEAPKILVDKVSHGYLGKKSGEGFYMYKNGQPTKNSNSITISANPEQIMERLLLRLINECVACLGEGIVSSADEIDAALIFAIGFPPFLGGPLHYAKTLGYEKIYEKLKTYEEKYGSRFAPKSGWDLFIKL